MSGCANCKNEKPFWAWDKDGSLDYGAHEAHIKSGTTTFIDTAGRELVFNYCPKCGEPLQDNGSKVGVITSILPPKLRAVTGRVKNSLKGLDVEHERKIG